MGSAGSLSVQGLAQPEPLETLPAAVAWEDGTLGPGSTQPASLLPLHPALLVLRVGTLAPRRLAVALGEVAPQGGAQQTGPTRTWVAEERPQRL